MALSDKLSLLEAQIQQYLALHENEHDTSSRNDIADKLRNMLSHLSNVKPPTSSGTASSKTINASVGVRGTNQADDVKAVQTILEVVVDGQCGPQTKNAIKKYQRENGIQPVSGLVEPNSPTWAKMTGTGNVGDNNDSGGSMGTGSSTELNASVGVRGTNQADDVKAVQTILEVVVDGQCGPQTKNAIKKYQRENGIQPVSGLVEPNSPTWAKMTGTGNSGSTGGSDTGGGDTGSTGGSDTGDGNSGNDHVPVTQDSLQSSVGDGGTNANPDVRLIQTMLNSNGYNLVVNGTADADVTRFIKDFQRRKQQNPTGIIQPDDNTFSLLNGQELERDTSAPTVAVNATLGKSVGAGGVNETGDVALVQQYLRDDWGYPIPIDGNLQDSTIQAIRQFQHRFAGMIRNQDGRVDPNGTTIKYLTGERTPTEGYTEDGIIGGVETDLEKQMGDFAKAFSGIRVEVRPGEWIAVRPPYHIYSDPAKYRNGRHAKAERARSRGGVTAIARSIGIRGHIGKATIAQIEDFLNQCIAGGHVKEADKTAQGLHEFLSLHGISTDCSGLAIQAANFLLQNDLERNKNNQLSEEVEVTNTAGIQRHPQVSSPLNLRAGDMMVNYKRERTGTYHVRIIVDMDEKEDHVAFTTVESTGAANVGEGGDGVGQVRWKFLNKTSFDNLQKLEGNNWGRASRSDQAYIYVRMRELANVE